MAPLSWWRTSSVTSLICNRNQPRGDFDDCYRGKRGDSTGVVRNQHHHRHLLPILTFERVEGKLFRPLAVFMNLNLIGAVIASMTIIPVVCAIVFSKRPPRERVSPVMTLAEKVYKPMLTWAMSYRQIVAAIAGALVVGSLCLVPFLGGEFIPELEEGNIWLRVTVLPTSVSLQKSVEIANQIRQEFKAFPEATNVITQVGTPDDGTDPNNYSNIEVFVDLKPMEQWEPKYHDKQELVTAINKRLTTKLPGLLYNFSQYIKDNMTKPWPALRRVGIKIYGEDLDVLTGIGNQIARICEKVPGLVDVAAESVAGATAIADHNRP